MTVGVICVDASGCGADCGGVRVRGGSGAEGLEAISSVETFSGRRLSGFSLTDAMSWGLVVFRTGCGNAGGGIGAVVVALVANNRAGTEAIEGGVVWGAEILGMAGRVMAVGGNAVRGSGGDVGGQGRNRWRRRGLKQTGRDGIENHRCLQTGFVAAGNDNPFEAAVAEVCRIGVESVGSCIERGKAEDAVLRCTGASFRAGGLVAQNECDAGERGRMQIGKPTGEGT